MYEYFYGKIIELSPTHCVVEVNGVGWYINISLQTYAALQIFTETKIFLQQIIREDSHQLFGFSDKKERDLFRLLNSVSGIGANTARMILSSLSNEELEVAILSENLAVLKSIKGIGTKTAQRLIIELKDKIAKPSGETFSSTISFGKIREEATSALIMLGFQKNAVEKTVDHILTKQPTLSLEEIVKNALKEL